MMLREHDVTGPRLPHPNSLNDVPIVKPWAAANTVKARRILTTRRKSGQVANDSTSGFPAGLRAESFMADEDAFSSDDVGKGGSAPTRQGGFYEGTYPTFMELVSVYEDNFTSADIEKVNALMRGMINRKLVEISSNAPVGRRTKTHDGTNYREQAKKRKKKT
jgi:hypothetical protein